MSKQLVNYVQSYISPMERECAIRFIEKMDRVVNTCVKFVLLHYNTFISLQIGSERALNTALSKVFPPEFLNNCGLYKPQFIDTGTEVVMFVIENVKRTDKHYSEALPFLIENLSRVIEYMLIQMTEIYFLCHSDESQFWNELYKDTCLSSIIKRLKLNEATILNASHSFLEDYQIERHVKKDAHMLIDSYIVALTRSKFY